MSGFFDTAQVASKKPQSMIPKCGSCGLLNHCESPKMPVYGEGKRKVLIVGDAPGPQDDAEGRPFRGSAGRILRESLASLGFDLDEDCWSTNSIICRLREGDVPTDDQVDWCRPNLMKTISTLQPSVIIPLGWGAIRSVLGPYYRESTGTVAQWVGWNIPLQKINTWVCPSYSPVEVSKSSEDRSGPVMRLWFDRHIEKAMHLRGKPYEEIPDFKKQVRIIIDPEESSNWLRRVLRVGGPVSFDYETNCLKPDREDAEIVSAAFTWRGVETMACPVVGEFKEALKEFLVSPVPKIGANTKFEDRWSRVTLGIDRVENFVWDCMLSAHHLDNRPDITSVKFQAFVRCGFEPWDVAVKPFLEAEDAVSLNRIRECDLRTLLVYNGLDALLEWKIAGNQKAEMRFQNV